MKAGNDFHQNLARRRKELGLTQDALARRLDVSPQAVSKWENTSYPDSEMLPLLTRALDTSLDSLFGIKSTDTEADLLQMIHDRIQTISPEKRPGFLMELFYSAIYAYNPSFHKAGTVSKEYDRETYAGLKTDYEISLIRLNPDLQYFTYLKTPEKGVNSYFTNTRNMVRLLKTLADEDAIRVISYLGSGRRNKMHSPAVISKRLGIPAEKVQYVIDRLDRLGIVWRVSVDLEEGETIMYGYTHNQALPMILTLAQSICNYFSSWDPAYDKYSFGVFRDETGTIRNDLPDISYWNDDDDK